MNKLNIKIKEFESKKQDIININCQKEVVDVLVWLILRNYYKISKNILLNYLRNLFIVDSWFFIDKKIILYFISYQI